MENIDEIVTARLKEVIDPELGVNIVDLGLIYDLQIENEGVQVQMTLTTPGCPLHDTIVGGVKRAVEGLPLIKTVEVEVVWTPAWTPERMSEDAKEYLGYF